MVIAILYALSVCSVGTEDVSYRILRAWVMHGLFYFGTFARDGVLASATGWPEPMRVASFVQVFAALFYQTNTFTSMPFKLEKAD